jgi:UDPglucose 6-dehydrogenase
MQDIIVIGAGYVGLVTAVGLAGPGRSVTVVEIEQRRLASLERGVVPIHEAGLQDAFTAAVGGGHLRVLGGVPEAPADVVFVCVGTPISDQGEADLSALDSSLYALRAHVDRGAVIVIRSTLPLGTTTRLVDRPGLTAARTLTNPEFLRQGTALADFRTPSRIVIGTSPSPDPAAVAAVSEAFASFGAPVLIVGY